MRLSPCQRHRQRIQAAKSLERHEALSASPDSLHLLLRELDNDLLRLSELPNIAEKVELKREDLLPRWLPTVERYLASGVVHENPVFAWCVVWLFDVGNFDQALDWADIAIAQNQPTPEAIRSSFPAFVADTVIAWAKAQFDQGYSIEPYFSRTFTNVTENWRIHEEIKAKWLKFAGLRLISTENGKVAIGDVSDVAVLEEADKLFSAAAVLYAEVGVKTVREKIAARIRALQKE